MLLLPGMELTRYRYALRDSALEFFNLPLEEKCIRRPKNDQNRGYIPYGEETLVRMAGGDSPPDYKEVFAIGPDRFPMSLTLQDPEATRVLHPIFGRLPRKLLPYAGLLGKHGVPHANYR
ncbi:MAG: hypothetical protein CM1200mP18_06640 [Gammaproteobacteria bacterium]|nr:MAG: hypothetical protein CM1200mP18_06640 [Gammaproteobacteria bacterium]